MLLVPWAILTAAATGAFLFGVVTNYTGIASIGAVLMLAVGGAVVLTDLEPQTGKTVERSFETVNNETVAVNETVSYEYETVAVLKEFGNTAGYFGFGALQMLAAVAMFTRQASDQL